MIVAVLRTTINSVAACRSAVVLCNEQGHSASPVLRVICVRSKISISSEYENKDSLASSPLRTLEDRIEQRALSRRSQKRYERKDRVSFCDKTLLTTRYLFRSSITMYVCSKSPLRTKSVQSVFFSHPFHSHSSDGQRYKRSHKFAQIHSQQSRRCRLGPKAEVKSLLTIGMYIYIYISSIYYSSAIFRRFISQYCPPSKRVS